MLIDANGKRFVDELQKRDHVSGRMWNNKGPFRLILNGKASKEIEWHCKHYCGRGLMKAYPSGEAIAKDMGIDAKVLAETFATYNKNGADNSCPFGKKFFHNLPLEMNDNFHVAQVCPVIHYCMGGIEGDKDGQVLTKDGKVIPGLYCAGEVMGGVHGKNRLGGNSLLDCVAFGRVAGKAAARFLLQQSLKEKAMGRVGVMAGQLGATVSVTFSPDGNVTVNYGGSSAPVAAAAQPAVAAAAPAAPAAAAPAPAAPSSFTMDDVAKHKTDKDCWVVVGDMVLDVTEFLPDHPGGKKAIMLFAGKDATEEFDMLHKREVIDKYAPDAKIGTLSK